MTNYNEIIGELQKRKVQLEASIAIANKKIEKLPEGKLRISYCRGNPQYYKIIDSADTHGKYIKKSDFKIAQELAQKDYLKKIIDVAQEELKIVKRAIGAGTNFPKTNSASTDAPESATATNGTNSLCPSIPTITIASYALDSTFCT